MTDYVALLRGVAPRFVGMRNLELAGAFEGAGLDVVGTVASSGNILLRSDDRSRHRLERAAEDALHAHLGRPCATIVRSRRQLERLLALDVFGAVPDEAATRRNVTFLQRSPRDPPPPPPPVPEGEVVAVRDGAVFLAVDTTVPPTGRLMAAVERTYGTASTTRTWRVVERIVDAF